MTEKDTSTALSVITEALKLPGVKVDRKSFLLETFKINPQTKLSLSREEQSLLINKGPISAGLYTPKEVKEIAKDLCDKRTLTSSASSFLAGLSGGLAIAATIPADVAQFYGFTLRIAQEVAYLYDKQDLWKDGILDENEIRTELILYLGTMLGVGGAASALRYLSASIAKKLATDLPKKALTKTFWYPILKSLSSYVGIKITKDTVGKAISKIVPILGGLISGGLTYVTLSKMSERLYLAFDKAADEYSDKEIQEDVEDIKEKMPDVYDAIFTKVTDSEENINV